MIPRIKVTLNKPMQGYWDGGKKQVGYFEAEGFVATQDKPKVGDVVKWGCYDFNFWFTSGTGSSWNTAVMYAKRMLISMMNTPAKVEVIYEET